MNDDWDKLIAAKKQAILKELKALKKHGKRVNFDCLNKQGRLKIARELHLQDRLKKC